VRTGARKVLGEKPQRARVAATSRGHRAWQGYGGVVARHGEAGGAARPDGGVARLGMARPRGAGAQARARVLVLQGRGVAVPCAGHQHPGPKYDAAAERRRRLWGRRRCDGAPAQEVAQGPGGKGVLRLGYGGLIGLAGSRGKEGEGSSGAHRGLASGVFGAVAGWCRRVGAVQGERRRQGHRTGSRPGEDAPATASSSSSCSPLPSSPLRCGGGGKGGWGLLGFRAVAAGVLMGRP
jgi:hypothetical protein